MKPDNQKLTMPRSTMAGRSARFSAFLIFGLSLAFVAATLFISPGKYAQAALSPSPCPGNICTGTVTVGNQAVAYSYTQHLAPNGQFRIRLNGGVYNTSSMVSFIVSSMPAFASTGYLANPTNGALAMTEVDVNPTSTSYERRRSNGCSSCIFDHVMSMQYSALAGGVYTFNLTVIQNGDSGGMSGLQFYVDATAPTNANESTTWTGAGTPSGMDFPCADGIDNDLDFAADCADSQCVGSVGKVVSGAKCESPEVTCNDGFDNDGNGKPDCLDPACNGKLGNPLGGPALCQYLNEYGVTSCNDGFDNDGDGLSDCVDNTSTDANPAHTCWKQAGCPAVETSCSDGVDNDKDQSYTQAWDNAPLTGVDCQDYDCAGNASCPSKENFDKNGVQNDALCFDGLDNDLDGKVDCADSDCAGAVNPLNPSVACYVQEFDLGLGYQFCADGFDNDGNGTTDCSDPSCKQKFGNCGPCPSREDYTWSSCADGKDNNSDGLIDCKDPGCGGKIGVTSIAATCAATENTDLTCSDGYDNDGNGKIDCADTNCAGHKGPRGGICGSENTGATCTDNLDNDGDGLIDCADPGCAGVAGSSCGPASWTQAASCQIVPRYSGPTAFTSNSPTVTAVVTLANHVSSQDVTRIIGSGSYSSVTIILGDNTDSTNYYPYAAASPTCTLKDTASGLTAAHFKFTAVASHALQIYDFGGGTISGFDLTLSCPTPVLAAAIKNYPISLSALKQPGNVTEYGDANFSTTLYEAKQPTVTAVEPEGLVGGTVRIPYGTYRHFRGDPADVVDANGNAPSGICRCAMVISGVSVPATADCVTSPVLFSSDIPAMTVQAQAEDGAGNVGPNFTSPAYSIDVTPANTTPLVLSSPAQPFFKAGQMAGFFDSSFTTATNNNFSALFSCTLKVYDNSFGSAGSTTVPVIVAGNTARCIGSATLPSLSDGRYFVTAGVTDNGGGTGESNRQTAYVCNSVVAGLTNGCEYADFDFDGTPEGLFTTLYSTVPKACDNCINLSNPSQTDTNANGVGDVCEPKNKYGRCEVDTDIVCLYDSNDSTHCVPGPADPMCCPGPSIKDDPLAAPGVKRDPQKCQPAWGLCSGNDNICFVDAQCPAGLCKDGTTSCHKDADCAGHGSPATCTGGEMCSNLLNPWIQTVYGNVFSKKKISVVDVPPQNQFNATFCVTAKETIVNFNTKGSGGCAATTDTTARFELPQNANRYATVQGKLDLAGLRNGNYGPVVTVSAASLDTTLSSYSNGLGGRVIRVVGDAVISAHTINNGNATKGTGTILVDGGNLTIMGDITYDVSSVTDLKQLASVGWIVLDDGSGTRGNVFIDGAVQTVVGAFYSNGLNGFNTVNPPQADSVTSLTVYGLVIAHEFQLNRTFKSLTQGAEQFIYDGRAVVNPAPGFADLAKALPTITDSPGP